MKNKVIITVAPTGNVPTKKDNPNVPITAQEIADDILACYQLGASVAHIHARDENGHPTADKDTFIKIQKLVRDRCDIITQFSTGARGGEGKGRGACLVGRPEMASLTTGSSNFRSRVNYNPPELIGYLAKKMYSNGIVPEIEIFDVSMINNALYLLQKGVLKKPLNFNLVLNVPGSIPGTPKNLLHMVELLPANCNFTVTGIGRMQTDLITMGILLGGNVRVGLEDTLVYSYKHNMPASNVMLVERIVKIIHTLDRDVATPDEARKTLGIS